MRRKRRLFGATCWPLLAMALAITGPAMAQKPGGTLKLYNIDSPASMSIHEEATVFSQMPMMAASTNRLSRGSLTHQYSTGVSRGPQRSASTGPNCRWHASVLSSLP